jgi:CBS domain containing-hemolysin-like protein
MVLTTILIGNNIVNITASALATDLSYRLLRATEYADTAVPVAIGVTTLLLLTFGEITPKTIAKAKHERIAGPMMWLLRGPYTAFYPATWLFAKMSRGLMTLAGSTLHDDSPNVTEEDIEYLVSLGSREGALEKDREKILQSAFEYTETNVREIMVPRTGMISLELHSTMHEVLTTLIESGHSRLPVYEGDLDNIVGLFYAKDLLRHVLEDTAEFNLKNFLRPAYYVPEPKKVSSLLSEFKRDRVHMAIVVDEFGGTSGVITLEDVLEEFHGEIQDEYDEETNLIEEQEDGVYLADARVEIDEVEQHLDVEFPKHPEYDTLGGFIVAQVGSVPPIGFEVSLENLIFRVEDADEKRVIRVCIEEVRAEPASSDEPASAATGD